MKVDLIRKFKWYIVGFILIAVMLSVSLSFSAWDTLSVSLKDKLANNGSGNFKETPDRKYVLATDVNGNDVADVGDIVTFGNYYQAANSTEKSPIRWIVVDKGARQDSTEGTRLTLLAEKVMAFGSFWGNWYYGPNNDGAPGVSGMCNQNYMQSTVRAWLNSNDSNIRTDGGTQFSKIYDSSKPQFRGFLEEAFLPEEREYILPKTISGMKGYNQCDSSSSPGSISDDYGSGDDKVWLPSYIEMNSNTGIKWGIVSDNLNDEQFEYFKAPMNGSKVAKTTKYASTLKSNYTMDRSDLTGSGNYQRVPMGSESPVWWMLRSPDPTLFSRTLYVGTTTTNPHTNSADNAVRPAVCLPL